MARNTRLEKKERRENTIITLEEKCFSRNTGIVKTLRDYRRLKKYLMSLRIHAENYFLSLINLWLGSSYLFPTCGSNRSHLIISSYRSIEASNGMPEPRHDCGTFKGNEETRASDDRENTTARLLVTIVNSAKGCHKSIAGLPSTIAHSSRWIVRRAFWGNYRWINFCPMNIETTIFVEGKEHSSQNGREWRIRSSWWVPLHQ